MARKKNPAAVALGKLGAKQGGKARMASLSALERSQFARQGGKVGGKARAAKLTKEQRSEIARKAVMARWQKRTDQQ